MPTARNQSLVFGPYMPALMSIPPPSAVSSFATASASCVANTVKVTLWNAAGSPVKTVNVVTSGSAGVFAAAFAGGCLGFLWWNAAPAKIFMGDTGSLALGGALGIVAVLIHQPFVLVIAGGVFVMEAVSVILQKGWFRYTRKKFGEGRRIFLMVFKSH